jgi:alpha-beta hydrolase superfamily lysophospholipase
MVLWVGLAAAVSLAIAYAFALVYCAESFTRSKRRRVQGTPEALGLRYDDVQFRAPDMTVLRGWFIESPGARAAVVMVHGDEGTRADPGVGLLRLQRAYLRNGFHVFAFDLRGRGESSGVRDRLGSAEQLDLETAVAYVRRRTSNLPVVLHGFGLGASLALQATAQGLGPRAVIADTASTTARGQLRHRWRHLPGFVFGPACWVARKLYHANVDVLRPIEAMPRIDVPLLLIHGVLDQDVPVANAHNLMAATLNPHAHLWVVPEAGHLQSYKLASDEYLRNVLRLIDEAIPARMIRLASTDRTAAAV